MTEEAQRVALAEACGWTRVGKRDDGSLAGRHPDNAKDYAVYEDIPDYLHSLDAMHEAEKVLTQQKAYYYADRLAALEVTESRWIGSHGIHTTAAQRAEAILRTLNLWDDTK